MEAAAFATGEPLSRDELLAAPLRTLPRPSLLERELDVRPPRAARAAQALGLETAGDLIEHFPFRHEDRGDIRPVATLQPGDDVTVAVTVRSISVRRMRSGGAMVQATVADETGPVKAVWFKQPWVADRLPAGTQVLIHGKYKGSRGITVSEYEVGGDVSGHTAGVVPVYPATEHLKSARIRELAWNARELIRHVVEPLPTWLRVAERLPDRSAAVDAVHFPDGEADEHEARRRLAFEELFLFELSVAARRRARESELAAPRLEPTGELVDPWVASLPFELTGAQRAATAEIDADVATERPMQRLLMGEVGSGKAQPLDSLVLTPTGFRPMGSITVGDDVLTPTGDCTTVVGVFPQGVRDVWRVRFADGTSVECDGEHLWQVRTSAARSRGDRPKVKPLREIACDMLGANGCAKWHVELPAPLEFDRQDERPIDPYVLGALLGDGSLARPDRVRFTSADPEMVAALRRLLPAGCELRPQRSRPYDWNIVSAPVREPSSVLDEVRGDDPRSLVLAYEAGASHAAIASRTSVSSATVRRRLLAAGVPMRRAYRAPSPIARALASLGLMGKTAHDKCVPPAYLNSPIEVRHALLQGLMDTDGTVNPDGNDVCFTSASKQLAEDVAWLVRSLGGRAQCRARQSAGGTYWSTRMTLPEQFPAFRLARKASRLRPRPKYGSPAKAIVGVEYAGRKPVQCIAVDDPDQLYVTDQFTVTHNTVVALHSMLRAVESGRQAALMAPTETLAEQHLATLDRLLGGHVPIALLTGSTPAARRREIAGRLASGELGLVVGTHALIEPFVVFRDLGLVVVDEQHRFGVRQRSALEGKAPEGLVPHVLHMTATPIPRTLQRTVYGDLDVTALRELPAGRQPIDTHVGNTTAWRRRAYERAREEIKAGRQVFVVCPLVEESEALQAKAATQEAEELQRTEFRNQRVALIHGQMSASQKQQAMRAFAERQADVLVATSVIEVGIDVPNATVMIIEAAERYGISQLHQLRGRIGRGEHASVCILFGDPGLPRLQALATHSDGFELAKIDLDLRGFGDVLGTRQHGLPLFRVARLPDDERLQEAAHGRAAELLDRDPHVEQPEHALLRGAAAVLFGEDREPIPA
jgi:ATP-dependent DNA helicase RecG